MFIGLFGSIFSIVAQIAVWSFVFNQNYNMIQYMIQYVIISRVLSILYENRITAMIGDKITTGDFAIDLIKPANPVLTFWSTSLGAVLASLLIKGTPILLIFSPMLFYLKLTLSKIILFILFCSMGFVLSNLIYILVGYLAFIVLEVWPFRRLVDDTIKLLSGAVVPLTFFPDWLSILAKLAPFHFMYSLPIRILLEDLPRNELMLDFVVLLAWNFVFLLGLRLVYRLAVKYSIVQGG